jgi:hypothetical protein
MKKNFDYDFKDYAVNKPPYTVGIPMILSISLFMVLTIIMMFEVFGSFNTFMNFPIFIFSLLVLVLVPLALRSTNRFYTIIITPRFIIERNGKREYTAINFTNITSFAVEKEGIVLRADKDKILLSVNLFKEEIDPIIDILEAKGKTFDPSKDFMIRPINIVIKNNKVIIKEQEDEEKIISELYDMHVKNYIALTPGFLDQLTFRNAVIENTEISEKNVSIKLGSITVREDHPENTSFGQMLAKDCIVLIENIVVKEVVIEGYEDLGKTDLIEMILASNDATTVTQVQYGENLVDLDLTVGVQACRIVFGYDHIFVGWKEIDKK